MLLKVLEMPKRKELSIEICGVITGQHRTGKIKNEIAKELKLNTHHDREL